MSRHIENRIEARIGEPAIFGEMTMVTRCLLESRERWRAMVCLGTDFSFETDSDGRFIVLAPDCVLGWDASELIGSQAEALLVCEAPGFELATPELATPELATPELGGTGDARSEDPGFQGLLFNPFRARTMIRHRRVWLREAGGGAACLLLSVAPVAGKPGAVRGLGIDVTQQEQDDTALAGTLLRREMTRMVARRMRRVVLPFASLTVALAEMLYAIDAQGAALLLYDPDAPLRIAAQAGEGWPGPPQMLHDRIVARCEQPPSWLHEQAHQDVLWGQSLLLCDGTNHFVDRMVLAIWRQDGCWGADEVELAAALLPAIQPIMEHEQIQRETARLSRTDILTGLFNRQGFIAESSRRTERLDREGLPATLMVVGLDGLDPLNAREGLQTGDTALQDAATILRDVVRPTDLVARLGGNLFALWLDGADQFTAAERAEGLRLAGIRVGSLRQAGTQADMLDRSDLAAGSPSEGVMTVSIGMATRSSRSFESIDSLLHRAWTAMQAAKQAGGGRWQVSTEDPSP